MAEPICHICEVEPLSSELERMSGICDKCAEDFEKGAEAFGEQDFDEMAYIIESDEE